MVFLIGGGNGSVREQEHEKKHAAAMQKWGKAQSRTMNRAKWQDAAARRAAEAGQQVTDPELVDALRSPSRACSKAHKRELERPRAPPARLEPAATRAARHGTCLYVHVLMCGREPSWESRYVQRRRKRRQPPTNGECGCGNS